MIEKIIVPQVFWSEEIGFNLKNAAMKIAAYRLFDIVDMFEEREMQAAESWRFRENETSDFGGPVLMRTDYALSLAL